MNNGIISIPVRTERICDKGDTWCSWPNEIVGELSPDIMEKTTVYYPIMTQEWQEYQLEILFQLVAIIMR